MTSTSPMSPQQARFFADLVADVAPALEAERALQPHAIIAIDLETHEIAVVGSFPDQLCALRAARALEETEAAPLRAGDGDDAGFVYLPVRMYSPGESGLRWDGEVET